MFKKVISLALSVVFSLQTCGFAQVGQLNLAGYLGQASAPALDRFRPAHLRYFSYEPDNDNFQILLDKADEKGLSDVQVKDKADELMRYFRIGLSLPNDKFWVNLRPDASEQIIDPALEQTDMGKIMLEADLQLKKDTSSLTSPQTKEGKEYWDKLYKKAGELFGSENITIPTITRPWIIPGEIIVRQSGNSAYIYKAALKVMLEEDYLNNQKTEKPKNQKTDYNFPDPRMKELNKYSTQLIRELIIPQLTKEVNRAKRYAGLRQVFYSLILARWFKQSYQNSGASEHQGIRAPVNENNTLAKLIDSGSLINLTSQEPWSKDTYYQGYKKSFEQGEYNLSQTVHTPTGQVIRRYISGGIYNILPEKLDDTYSVKPNIVGSSIVEPVNSKLLKYTSGGETIAIAASPVLKSLKYEALVRLKRYLSDGEGGAYDKTYTYIYNTDSIAGLKKAFDNTAKWFKDKSSRDTKILDDFSNTLSVLIRIEEAKKILEEKGRYIQNICETYASFLKEEQLKALPDIVHELTDAALKIKYLASKIKKDGISGSPIMKSAKIDLLSNEIKITTETLLKELEKGGRHEYQKDLILRLQADLQKLKDEINLLIAKEASESSSELTADNEMSGSLKDWEIFKSIEVLALNQPVVSFETNILIGKKVYTIIKASKRSQGDGYWTIELLENAKSRDPATQIRVYEDGKISAMALKALSDTERSLVVARLLRHFYRDKSERETLLKEGLIEIIDNLETSPYFTNRQLHRFGVMKLDDFKRLILSADLFSLRERAVEVKSLIKEMAATQARHSKIKAGGIFDREKEIVKLVRILNSNIMSLISDKITAEFKQGEIDYGYLNKIVTIADYYLNIKIEEELKIGKVVYSPEIEVINTIEGGLAHISVFYDYKNESVPYHMVRVEFYKDGSVNAKIELAKEDGVDAQEKMIEALSAVSSADWSDFAKTIKQALTSYSRTKAKTSAGSAITDKKLTKEQIDLLETLLPSDEKLSEDAIGALNNFMAYPALYPYYLEELRRQVFRVVSVGKDGRTYVIVKQKPVEAYPDLEISRDLLISAFLSKEYPDATWNKEVMLGVKKVLHYFYNFVEYEEAVRKDSPLNTEIGGHLKNIVSLEKESGDPGVGMDSMTDMADIVKKYPILRKIDSLASNDVNYLFIKYIKEEWRLNDYVHELESMNIEKDKNKLYAALIAFRRAYKEVAYLEKREQKNNSPNDWIRTRDEAKGLTPFIANYLIGTISKEEAVKCICRNGVYVHNMTDRGGYIYIRKDEAENILNLAKEEYEEKSKQGMASSGTVSQNRLGAVDFRVMDMLIQPQGSFKGLDFSPAALSGQALEAMDLERDLEGINQMTLGRRRAHPQRLKEYISACIFKGKIDEKADDFILSMLEVFQLQAEEGIESAALEREAVVLADTRGYVLPEKRLAASNGYSLN